MPSLVGVATNIFCLLTGIKMFAVVTDLFIVSTRVFSLCRSKIFLRFEDYFYTHICLIDVGRMLQVDRSSPNGLEAMLFVHLGNGTIKTLHDCVYLPSTRLNKSIDCL